MILTGEPHEVHGSCPFRQGGGGWSRVEGEGTGGGAGGGTFRNSCRWIVSSVLVRHHVSMLKHDVRLRTSFKFVEVWEERMAGYWAQFSGCPLPRLVIILTGSRTKKRERFNMRTLLLTEAYSNPPPPPG